MRKLTILAAICLALLSVGLMALGPDFADLPFIDIYEVPDGAMVPGHVWIRLKPELSGQLQRLEHTNGTLASFGIAELDELSRRFEVSKISQLFYSPAHRGEFTQRHRDWGLHLWYEISFSSKADIRDIVMAYRGLKGSVEWAEPEYKKCCMKMSRAWTRNIRKHWTAGPLMTPITVHSGITTTLASKAEL